MTDLSRQAVKLAVVWHVVVGAVLLALAAGWRPSRRAAGIGAALPLLSVSMLAWLFRNAFNSAGFLAAAAGVGIGGALQGSGSLRFARPWARFAGLAMIAFGWVYPHFLEDRNPLSYGYAAPMGLIPCPTLSMVVGFSLLLEALPRSGSLMLVGMGLFYGILGWFRLGVAIDAALMLGSALLALKVFRNRRPCAPLPGEIPPS